MPRPTERLSELKARYRLEDVVAAVAPLHGLGNVRTGKCPIHGGRHNSFAVYVNTQTWQCYSACCDRGGDLFDFLGGLHFGAAWNSRDRGQFAEVLAQLEGGALQTVRQPRPDPRPPSVRPDELDPRTQTLLHLAASLYHTTLLTGAGQRDSAYAYLHRERGFTQRTIAGHGLGYAEGNGLLPVLAASGFAPDDPHLAPLIRPETGRERMAGRIIFCDRDRAGRVLHLIGRRFAAWLSDEAPKYLSLSEITKPLYGYACLDKRANGRPVFLVEGPPDQLTLHQWGYDALANLGTRLTAHHAALLAQLRRPVIVVPNNDADPAKGLAAAESWLESIGHGTLLRLPDAVKDVNELAQRPHGGGIFAGLLGSLRVA